MNYLAHSYLSFGDSEILVGNMISDYVKGKKKFDYPLAIQKGIMLHRTIDTFTDTHPATKAAIVFFKPVVGTYAGAFVDVVYDHFLAKDETEFPGETLSIFASDAYKKLSEYYDLLPERFQRMLPHMINQNWLLNYRTMNGIENSFAGIFRRAKYIEYTKEAFQQFEKYYSKLQDYYTTFFGDVKNMALQEYKLLKTEL